MIAQFRARVQAVFNGLQCLETTKTTCKNNFLNNIFWGVGHADGARRLPSAKAKLFFPVVQVVFLHCALPGAAVAREMQPGRCPALPMANSPRTITDALRLRLRRPKMGER
jgi:hypothetical protein